MAADNIRELKEQLELVKKLIKAEGDLAKKQELMARATSLDKVIKNLNKYDDSLTKAQKSQQNVVDGMNQFGQSIANLPLGNYLKFEDISQNISQQLGEVQENIDKVSRSINQDFAKSYKGLDSLGKPIKLDFRTNEAKSVIAELNQQAAGMGDDFRNALESKDVASFFKKYGDEGKKAAEASLGKKGFIGAAKYFGKDGDGPKDLKTFTDAYKKLEEEGKNFQRITFDTAALWGGIRQNMLQNFGLGRIIKQVTEFDNNLANLKKEFQIPISGFKGASEAMADLTVKGAKFGLSTQESFEMVKTIGDEMKSSNVKNLAEIAQSVAAVPAAMGIASGEVAKITGQLMFFSQNADKVQSSFKNIGKYSGVFGQNATKVAKQFGDAYPKFKMMGMKGNESAIAAMAAQAEKLGINLADSVQSSKNFLDIGEAMEAAADLSLLGGAAAQVSYADLMQARLDPKKMIEIQDKITSGLGKFNKATGEVDFGYSDLVQMEQMAQRLGVSQEVLMKRAKGQREDAAKAAVFDQNMFKGLSPEEKTFLLSKVVSKGGGKFGIEGFDGIKDLKGLSSAQVKAQMSAALQDKKTTEDLAKERASFEETVNRMKGTIMALFNRFQPILQMLTNVLVKVIDVAQGFSNAISKIFGDRVGKYVKASIALGAILMLTMGPSAIAKFSGMLFRGISSPLKLLSGLGSKISTAFKGGGGKAAESLSSGSTDLGGKMKGGKAGPTFLQQFAKISPGQILSVAAAMIALGIAMMLIGKGIQYASNGLTGLVKAFNDSKNAGMALAAVVVVMGGFVAMMALMPPIITAIGAAGAFAAPGLLALGLAFLGIGAGIFLASKGLAAVASSMVMMGKNIGATFKGALGLIALAGALALISPALIVFGAASLIAVPGMFALGFLLKGLGATKGVNPGIIKAVADSMGSIAWGLFKLGAAAVVAPLAIIAAVALNFVGMALNNLKGLDSKKIVDFGKTLSLFATSVTVGLGLLGLVSPYAILALASAVSINLISKLLNNIKPVDQKNITAFANSLAGIGLKMAWGLTKLAFIVVPATAAIPGALMLNTISRLLNGVKPVNEKNMAAFGNSLKMVGLRMIVGLTALSIISAVGITALPGALMLNMISRLLNGVKAVDPKNMTAFGNSLAQVSGKVLWGLTKLSMVSVVGALAMPGALMLNTISRLLNGVKPVNEKNMEAFGKSLSHVTGKVMWGLIKLSAVGPLGILALPGAMMLNLISRLLAGVKPVDEKNMAAFGRSLAQVGPNVVSGMRKLASIAIPSILAGVAANRIASISKSLNSIVPINKEKIISFANAMGQVSGKMVWGVVKLGLIAVPAILATTAANRLVSISKSLNALIPVNPAKIMLFATSMGMVSSKMLWGMVKLGLMAIPAMPAVSAANRLVLISKSLNSIVPVNPAKMLAFGTSMGMVSGKVVWGIAKLALIALPAIAAATAANRIAQISKSLNSISPVDLGKIQRFGQSLGTIGGKILWGIGKLALIALPASAAASASSRLVAISKNLAGINPVNTARISQLSKAMSSVGGWAISKLALLSIPASAAASTAKNLSRISMNLMFIAPVNTKKIESLMDAMGSVGGIALGKFALLSIPAKKALNTATDLMNLSKNLNSIVPVNIVKIMMLNSVLAIASKLKSNVKVLGDMALSAGKASMSATYLLLISRNLSALKTPNVAAVAVFGKSLELISGKVVAGVKNLGLLYLPLLLASKSASLMAGTSRSLSLVKAPVISDIAKFGSALSLITGKVIWGVTKLGLMVGPLALANKSAQLMASTSRYLSQVKSPAVSEIAKFGASLSLISGKVMWGVAKLGLLYFPLVLANKAAALMVSTSRSLGLVKAPNIPAMALFGASLSIISGKVMAGVTKLGLLYFPLVLANKAAALMVSTSKSLGLVKVPNISAMAMFGASLSIISGKVMWGVIKLGLLVGPLALANKAAYLLATTSKNLGAVKTPNITAIGAFGSTVAQISFKVMFGVMKLALLAVPLALANISAKLIVKMSETLVSGAKTLTRLGRVLNTIPIIRTAPLVRLGSVLSSSMPKVLFGIMFLSRALAYTKPAAIAARGLRSVALSIRQIPQVFFLGLRSVGLVLSSQMPKVLSGVRMLVRALPYIPASIISARGLAAVSRSIKTIPQVFFLGLSSIGKVLSSQMPRVVVGLSRLTKVIPFISSSVLAARGVAAISRTLKTITPINAKAIMDLAKVVNNGGSLFFKGIMKWFMLSAFMGPAVRSIANVSKIFLSLNAVGGVNGPKILATLPVLNKMAGSLTSFAGIGLISPLLVGASIAVRILGQSLGTAAAGFSTFTKVPWSMMNSAAKSMTEVVNSLNGVANKVAISPNLSALARTFYVLGLAMRSVSTGFSSTARAMAEFNTQSERLKVNTGKAEITARVSAAGAVTEKGAAAGTRRPAAVFNPAAPAAAEKIMIAPIEINLKLNGMQIQKLITEANFYRT